MQLWGQRRRAVQELTIKLMRAGGREGTDRDRCESKRIREMMGESNFLSLCTPYKSVHTRTMASNPMDSENNIFTYFGFLFYNVPNVLIQ